jgi:hypothetical protein
MYKLSKSGKQLTRLRKHIAYFLFVIYFFPITFQSIHIVWHHSHGYKGKQIFFDKSSHRNRENISKEIKLCPIGEYQFSINALPKIYFFNSKIPITTRIYNEGVTQQQYKEVFSDQSPRAPPVQLA